MSIYYGFDGKPISREQFKALDLRVAATDLPDGRWVSTVLLGIDHRFGSGPPIIFETLVFPFREGTEAARTASAWSALYGERYCTLDEAKAGHDRIVAERLAGQHVGDAHRRKPAPPPGHGDAWADLIEAAGPDHPLREAMVARRALGIERYGVPLQYGTGLDFDAMAQEELLDAAVYLWAGGRRSLAMLMLTLAKLEDR